MHKISKIKIENIKRYGTSDISFDVNIVSGKVNIVVVPNGFGKFYFFLKFVSILEHVINIFLVHL